MIVIPVLLLLIMKKEDKPAGQIRFDIEQQNALLSFSLDREFRGKGLSKELIKGGLQRLNLAYPEVTRVQAFVKSTNIPSIRCFEKLNFEQLPTSEKTLTFIHHF